MALERIYLDHAASTPVDERVTRLMQPYFSADFGNPSSVHLHGQRANAAVEQARACLAQVLNCSSEEIVFTGCGSESDNMALRGVALAERMRRGANRILTTPIEHPAVLQTARLLSELFDFQLDLLPVSSDGLVDPAQVEAMIGPETALVSVIYANNEVGTINPIAEIGAICRSRQIPFHTDAVQAAGQLSLDVRSLNVDLLSLSAHKFYGPKGIGGLYIRKGTPLQPILTGGDQEGGRRAGTHNVPLIVGLGEALRLAYQELNEHTRHYADLRDRLIEGLLRSNQGARLSGHPQLRLPNHASFVFEGIDAGQLLAALDLEGFACSSGAACHAGSTEPSPILTAMGYSPTAARGPLRITVGRHTTLPHIDGLLEALPKIVERLRAFASSG